MPFYTTNNTDLTINGTGYYVSEASIGSDATLTPVYSVGSDSSDEYYSNGDVPGNLSMTYFLTGVDPIKELMNNNLPVSGNFCGLYFDSGYLTSYSLGFGAHQPVRVSASFSFFGKMSGTFTAGVQSSRVDHDTLNCSDFEFNETGILSDKQIMGLDYSYSTSVTPYYSVQETGENPIPSAVLSAGSQIGLNISTNDYSINLPSTGLLCKGKIILKDSSGTERESYNISGVMNSQSMSATDPLVKSLSISQANLALPPAIDTISPVNGAAGTTVKISGSDFQDVETVILQDQPLDFTLESTTGVVFVVPSDAMSGPVRVKTRGGSAISTGTFTVS